LRDLTHNLREVIAGREVLVLGAGGAARGILQPLLAQKPRRLVIANRTHAKAAELASQFAADGSVVAIKTAALDGERFDVVINATSIGLGIPVPRELWPSTLFAPGALAYDLVYADQTTPFLRWASEQGAAKTADGLGMLVEQAAESFVLWRGVRPDTAPVFALMRN
jgi:shikimate dehydrogenase